MISFMSQGVIKATSLFIYRNQICGLLTMRRDHFWKIESVQDENERNNHLKSLKLLKTTFHLYLGASLLTAIGFFGRALIREGRHTAFDCYCPDWLPYYLLLAYVKKMNETFSIMLLVYNGIIVLSMCVAMYIIST
ncbi:hypothetical protein NQ318_003699, partial [Aromia moschata]